MSSTLTDLEKKQRGKPKVVASVLWGSWNLNCMNMDFVVVRTFGAKVWARCKSQVDRSQNANAFGGDPNRLHLLEWG